MELYSQKDPAYGHRKLGKSKLTVSGFGCFVCSIATLYQRHPEELLAVTGGIQNDGNLISDVLARACGGRALPGTTKPPTGWCIAKTDHYASAGYPTHFFCVNPQTREQIDPLDLPAKVEPLTYRILEYRPFTNTVLDTSAPVPVPVFADVAIGSPGEAEIKEYKERGIVKGYPDGLFRPDEQVSRRELMIILKRLGL